MDEYIWFVPIAPGSIAFVSAGESGLLRHGHFYDEGVWAVTMFLWSLAAKPGIWRAANAYSGPRGWAVLAKLHVFADGLLPALVAIAILVS